MVSKASDDFPDPLNPVMTVKVLRGISTSMFFRLCCRAPCTVMRSSNNSIFPYSPRRPGQISFLFKAIAIRNGCGGAGCGYKSGMTRERMTTIWSLARRAEVALRIYYRVRSTRPCRVLVLERIEQFDDAASR